MDPQESGIQALLDEVNSAGNALLHPTGGLAEGPARRRLVAVAQKLVHAAQNPLEAAMEVSFQNHRTAVIRACDDLGVFQLVPQTGSMSLQELVGKTGANRQLLFAGDQDRFMRMLTATGIFAEVEKEVYAHNGLSLACGGPAKHVMNHIYVELSNASYKFPEYLRRTSYDTKPDPDGFSDPTRYALGTKESVFSWLLTQPDRLTNFNLAMKTNSSKAKKALSNYPFGAELAAGDSENEILIVDVGGGRGHVVEAIRARFPGLKGRMIVQDLRETVEEIEDPKGFEPMAHDFFEPQPVKGK
ncbi:MAG: hypothetical protein M1840_009063 [Geoglossum simile]|nr:MAG: hypothetical protein M1840_009063 [Geoglossum simile]